MKYATHEDWVTMNDGVRLDTQVYIPDGTRPASGWPAVLLVHGHGDAGNKMTWDERARRYADRGYLTVTYSVRGQGASEGLSFHLGAREIFDLQDMIAWVLADLPIDSQKLAVAGSSQGGWHSYMAAAFHAGVATVVPENIFTDYGEFAVYNGCLARWFFTRTMRRRIMTAGLQELARQWAISGEWHRIQEWVRPTSPRLFARRIRCPIFILHGWHDMGMPANEPIALYNQLGVPKRLYLGGGGHDGHDNSEAMDFRTGLIDRWLDHWLLGQDTGLMDEPSVVYVQRPGWNHSAATDWPPPSTKQERLFLHGDGKLRRQGPTGPDTHANVANRPLRLDYDLAAAIYDDMAGVPDGLARELTIFDGDPLEHNTEIVGAPQVRFHMLGNSPFLQVHAELYAISSDGQASLITRGHFGTRTATPGQHLLVPIECRAISYRVSAGDHLRLVVSNYDTDYVFPYFEPFCARLFHDNSRPSYVEFETVTAPA